MKEGPSRGRVLGSKVSKTVFGARVWRAGILPAFWVAARGRIKLLYALRLLAGGLSRRRGRWIFAPVAILVGTVLTGSDGSHNNQPGDKKYDPH